MKAIHIPLLWLLLHICCLTVSAQKIYRAVYDTYGSYAKMRPEDSKRGYVSTLIFGKKIKAGKAEVIKLLRYYISNPIGYYNMQNPDAPAELIDASTEDFKETFINIEK
ncbi:hypothetical protein [Porphyromonas sp.]|uniref:hypothetical protein n=1 Tax=Porphyromonas sp. TaxID=1924944 RepID=UPI0026DB9010|nr:hypothetical protein [Porphyromonas sp.]MDO4770599.1 hypothetical protein [Porphyromonas sp.]